MLCAPAFVRSTARDRVVLGARRSMHMHAYTVAVCHQVRDSDHITSKYRCVAVRRAVEINTCTTAVLAMPHVFGREEHHSTTRLRSVLSHQIDNKNTPRYVGSVCADLSPPNRSTQNNTSVRLKKKNTKPGSRRGRNMFTIQVLVVKQASSPV